MKKISLLAILIFVLTLGLNSYAQQNSIIKTEKINNFTQIFSKYGKYGLLDPSKFDMKQSFSMTYQTNGKQSLMSNIYVNTLSYQISKPLSMKIHLGVAHSPSAFSSILKSDETHFLPGLELTYKPSNNFIIHFEYNTYNNLGTNAGLWDNTFYSPSRMAW